MGLLFNTLAIMRLKKKRGKYLNGLLGENTQAITKWIDLYKEVSRKGL